MSRLGISLAIAILAAVVSLSGCCAPCAFVGAGPIGPGCIDTNCNSCDGGCAVPQISNGPIDALRNARRRVICGSGCGEAYLGEWISTPPDAVDPCYQSQFVGGATKCQPFCWQPGVVLGGLARGLYGKRLCTGNQSSAPCGCGSSSCGGTVISESVISSPVISSPVVSGCSSCVAASQGVQTGKSVATQTRPASDTATATAKRVVVRQAQGAVKKAVQKVDR